ncbi:MAG: effector-binding domain-containing protein [Flavobacteriales bacterium]|jgi:effector-binding domain-containing protein
MKFLKVLLAIGAILVAVFVIVGLTADGSYEVERSVVIDGCYGDVYDQTTNWEKWNVWSPWNEKASDIVYTYSGELGTVGSSYTWESASDDVGAGMMTCTGLSETKMEYHLNFTRPFESESDGYVTLDKVDEGVKVSWGFFGEFKFPMTFMPLIMPMDEAVGPDFQIGLENLKGIVEAMPKSDFSPEIVQNGNLYYLGKAAHLKVDDISPEIYAANYAEIMLHMLTNDVQMDTTSMPFAIYHMFDETTYEADMEFAIPVVGEQEAPEGLSDGILVAGDYLLGKHLGSYDTSNETWEAMDTFIACEQLQVIGAPYEMYIAGPRNEPDTSKWVTHVYYPIASAQ